MYNAYPCMYIFMNFMRMDGQSCTFVFGYPTQKLLCTPLYLVFYLLNCTFSHFYIMHSFGYLEKKKGKMQILKVLSNFKHTYIESTTYPKEVHISQYKIHKMVLERCGCCMYNTKRNKKRTLLQQNL